MKGQYELLGAMERLIARCVLRGDIEGARNCALDLARVRDEQLTSDELLAASGALR